MINFYENGEIWGYSTVNQVYGSFILEDNNDRGFKKISFGQTSLAMEHPNGFSFIDAMKEVNRYDITSRGLLLYQSSREYLLFEPKME